VLTLCPKCSRKSTVLLQEIKVCPTMRMLIYSRKMSNPTAANSDIEITESMYCQNRICATSRCPPPAMDAMVDIFIAVGLAPTMSKHSGRRESVLESSGEKMEPSTNTRKHEWGST